LLKPIIIILERFKEMKLREIKGAGRNFINKFQEDVSAKQFKLLDFYQ
jgi:hypothetical protein